MTTYAPQHLRQRPIRSSIPLHRTSVRRTMVLTTGAAVTVPLGATAFAPGAHAAPTPAPMTPSAPATPMTPSTPTQVVTLKYGSTGSLVRTAQSRLGVSADGVFGPRTLQAVKSFQARKGLVADGIVGALTWRALGGFPSGSTPSPTPPPTSPTPNPPTCTVTTVRYGSSGQVVSTLQRRLGLRADGVFGAQTLSGLKSFQSRKGLVADGIAGPRTWSALGGYPCDAPPPGGQPSDPPSTDPGEGSVTGQQVVDIAKRYLGTPYLWGGTSPAGFDCSGFTSYVYRQVGITLPRTSSKQSYAGTPVSTSNLRIGDLVFFHSPISHVGIYVGDGMMIDAERPGTRIYIHKFWFQPVKAVRLL